jgi:hypothetical protein
MRIHILPQESPHFASGPTPRLFGLIKGRTEGAKVPHCAWHELFLDNSAPELALLNSSCENRPGAAPTLGCTWFLGKMRG